MSTIPPAKDFFISYNKADRNWAVWIAWELEEAGYAVIIQEWDFRGNFILEMDRGHREASRTIAVLSPDYVKSLFVQPEWAARLAQDPAGSSDRLIPIQVREVELEGLLAQIIHTDLVALDERQARDRLLKRASGQRLKPVEKPGFPGVRPVGERPSFPGTPAPPVDRMAYAKQARKLFDVLDLTALAQPGAIDPDVERPRLSQLFVPQYARKSRPPQTLPRDYLDDQEIDPDDEMRQPDFLQDHWARAERLPVLDLLGTPEAHSAVLLGDPGAGKSSLARYLLLRQVAWRMNEASEGLRANAITETNLRAELERYFEVAWNFDKARQRRAAREMIDLLEKRTWILTLRGPALYGFVHRPFLEYLCALELLRRLHDGDMTQAELQQQCVFDRIGDDAWPEVIRLFFAQISWRQANSIIAELINHRYVDSLALAFECLAEREARDLGRMRVTCT